MAATAPIPDLTKSLIEKGAAIKVFDEDDNTPLHIALQCEKRDIAEILAEATSSEDVNHRNKQGQTPLLLTTKLSAERVLLLKILIQKGAKIDIADNEGNTPFSIYFHQHQSLIVEDSSIFCK